MIDIHTHLLPGVDDGSPSVEVSVPVLERFAADGVEVLVCTPHLNASNAREAPYDRHLEILEILRAEAPAQPELQLGWEIMLDVPGVDLSDRRFTLGNSNAVLVEFPRQYIPPNAAAELFRIRMSGVVPVLAHPERYYGCTVALVDEWKRAGAVIQMDAAALAGSGRVSDLANGMLAAGLVDIIASDTHGDRRSLGAARDWLHEIGAEEQARLMTRTNPGRLLSGEAVLPVPAVLPTKGMLGRLKELLLGRR